MDKLRSEMIDKMDKDCINHHNKHLALFNIISEYIYEHNQKIILLEKELRELRINSSKYF